MLKKMHPKCKVSGVGGTNLLVGASWKSPKTRCPIGLQPGKVINTINVCKGKPTDNSCTKCCKGVGHDLPRTGSLPPIQSGGQCNRGCPYTVNSTYHGTSQFQLFVSEMLQSLFVYQIVTGPEIISCNPQTSNRFGHSSNHNFVCMCGVYGGCRQLERESHLYQTWCMVHAYLTHRCMHGQCTRLFWREYDYMLDWGMGWRVGSATCEVQDASDNCLGRDSSQ